MRYWHGYLSGARCKWVAYDPADATLPPHHLLLHKNPNCLNLSGAGLPSLSWKTGLLNGCLCLSVLSVLSVVCMLIQYHSGSFVAAKKFLKWQLELQAIALWNIVISGHLVNIFVLNNMSIIVVWKSELIIRLYDYFTRFVKVLKISSLTEIN